MTSPYHKSIEPLIASTKVLIIDDDYYMRKVIRSLLLAIGIKDTLDASNGSEGLEAICSAQPDIVILDWEMPGMTGADFMRIVRSPETFQCPQIPVIMLTGHVERETVVEAVRLGVNEFLCKPVSAKTLYQRILAIRAKPREMVRIGDYYGPAPRRVAANAEAVADPSEPVWLS